MNPDNQQENHNPLPAKRTQAGITRNKKSASPIEKSREILWYKYFQTFNFYFSKPIDEILLDSEAPHVLLFKDYLYYDDEREFLRRSYTINEFQERHKLLCSLYNNLDFMTRPNLAKHSQNDIIMKRNLKLQKLFFLKLSSEAENRELLAQKIPVIPRYIEDNIYSSTTEVESQKTKLTVSLADDSALGKNVLSTFRNQEGNSVRKDETGFGGESRANSQALVKEASIYNDIACDSLKRIEMDMKGLKETEPVSLGSSFNSSNVNPQFIQGIGSTIDSRGLLSEEIDLIYNYSIAKVNNRIPASPEQNHTNKLNDSNDKKQNRSAEKRKNDNMKNFGPSADPRVALQNFSKANSPSKQTNDTHVNSSPTKAKAEGHQKIVSRNLMQAIQADMKREVHGQYQGPTLADKVLGEKIEHPSLKNKYSQAPRDQNPKERGATLRVSASPKINKINLNKSPQKFFPLNTPIDPQSPVVEKKSLAGAKTESASKMKEERSPVYTKRSPKTAKINLNDVSERSRTENSDIIGHNNKSIIPSIKNLVMKFKNTKAPSQSSDEFLKTIKGKNFNINKITENPLISRPETKRVSLVSGNSMSPSKDKSQDQQPLSTTCFLETEHHGDILSLSVQNVAKSHLNTTMGMQTLDTLSPEQFPQTTLVSQGSLDMKAGSKVKEAWIDNVSEKKFLAPAYRFIGKKETTPNTHQTQPVNHHCTTEESYAKTESSVVKGRIARTSIRGGSWSNFDHLKRTVKIDMQIKSDAETRAETRGQSHESRVLSDDSDQAEFPRQNSLGKESAKLIYIPTKVPGKRDSHPIKPLSPKTRDFKMNFEKSQQQTNKSAHNESSTRLGSSEVNQSQNSGLGNNKSPLRTTTKVESKSEKKPTHKTTDQLPVDTGIKLTVVYHSSGKSLGSYPSPNDKGMLLSEAERLKRREVLRKIAKSK